jgi:hypothetical protein
MKLNHQYYNQQMHGENNVKIVHAQQANPIYQNTKSEFVGYNTAN